MDDTLLMDHPSTKEEMSIQESIDYLMLAYGMTINQENPFIFFFNIPLFTQCKIIRILGFQKGSLLSKYLGAPPVENTLRNISWEIFYLRWRENSVLGPLDLFTS